MKVLIIEDELPAAKRLKTILNEIDDSILVLDIIESVSSAIKWFQQNQLPDIVFMDIQLSDGLSFEIFNKIEIKCPIIFTTAFDEYAIQAFKVNSIDYLLKPIETKSLERSLDKLRVFKEQFSYDSTSKEILKLFDNIQNQKPVYKSRFLIKTGQSFIRINTSDCAYFLLDNKLTYVVTFTGKKFIVDYTLEELETQLDPKLFNRVNRQFILNIDSIKNIHSYFSGKLKLHVIPETNHEIIVSRAKAAGFRIWMES